MRKTGHLGVFLRHLVIVLTATCSLVVLASAADESKITGRFFKQTSTWYTPIPANPLLMPESEKFIQKLVERTSAKSLAVSFRDYAVPIWKSRSDIKNTTVEVTSEISKAQGWNVVPIPAEAVPAGNEASLSGSYRDGHMVVIGYDGMSVWDFYQAVKYPDGRWKAKYLRKWDLAGEGINQPYDGLGSAHVAPTPLIHGLITYSEIAEGEITHAIAFTMDSARAGSPGVYPAAGPNSGRCSDPYCLELGFRLQLDPTLDISTLGLNRFGEITARALQKYGMMFVVNAGPGGCALIAESLDDKTETWQGIIGSLSGIPMNRLRVIQPVYPGAVVEPPSPPSAPKSLRIIPASE